MSNDFDEGWYQTIVAYYEQHPEQAKHPHVPTLAAWRDYIFNGVEGEAAAYLRRVCERWGSGRAIC